MCKAIVYVVDDDPAVPGGLRASLSTMGWRVECYVSGREFLEKFDPDLPGCLLLDLRMEDMHGLEVQAALKARGVELPTIIVTGYADVPTTVEAMQRGAIDLLEKPVHRHDLISRIELGLKQDIMRREKLASRVDLEARWGRLTPGERAVVRMLIDGKSSREIGSVLKLGRRTIENRRANIMLKMDATSLAHLVRIICGAGADFPPPEPPKDQEA